MAVTRRRREHRTAERITRYAERFAAALGQIDQDIPDPRAKLDAYVHLYEDVLRGERMCMCAMLAAEYQTLPKPMRNAVMRFFDENERWLADVLAQGRADKSLSFTGSANEIAQRILATLEGAMLLARPYADPNRFNATAQQLLASVTPYPMASKRPPQTRSQAKPPIPKTTSVDPRRCSHAAVRDAIKQPPRPAC
jgi:TetR/AcrR family transcriptional regulator, transcriptional repressor for nem operon